MKLNKQQMEQTQRMLDHPVPEEFLQTVFDGLPDDVPFEFLQSAVAGSIRKLGEEAVPGQVVKDALEELKAKKLEASEIQKPGDARRITREYFDSLLIEQRLMETKIPDTSVELFGERFSTPIMTAALSHLGVVGPDRLDGMSEYARAAELSNTLHWVGMCEDSALADCLKSGAKTVRIIKPYRDSGKIYAQMKTARELGCVGLGMDIDHFLTRTGDVDTVFGEPMEIKTPDQMGEYIKDAGLPFVIKGVLSVKDALKAVELGAAGIVVSHHGGRMDYVVPPLMILEEIASAVKGRCLIFVDCGIASGMDAYKALALGADAVSVGTHLLPFLKEGGAAFASREIDRMTAELKGVMAYTGVGDTGSFDASVIHRRSV